MSNTDYKRKIKILGEAVRDVDSNLSFTILEVGALQVEEQAEPFHQLLDIFPESKIIAFEVNENLCEELNKKAILKATHEAGATESVTVEKSERSLQRMLEVLHK